MRTGVLMNALGMCDTCLKVLRSHSDPPGGMPLQAQTQNTETRGHVRIGADTLMHGQVQAAAAAKSVIISRRQVATATRAGAAALSAGAPGGGGGGDSVDSAAVGGGLGGGGEGEGEGEDTNAFRMSLFSLKRELQHMRIDLTKGIVNPKDQSAGLKSCGSGVDASGAMHDRGAGAGGPEEGVDDLYRCV